MLDFPARDPTGDAAFGQVPLGGDGASGLDGRVGTGPPPPPGTAPEGGSPSQPPPGPRDGGRPDPEDGGRPAPDFGLAPEPAEMGAPPPPRPPRARLDLVRGASPVGCRPHDIGLTWDTAAVAQCTLTKAPGGEIWDVAPLPNGSTEWPAVPGDAVFTLDCRGDDGTSVEAQVAVRPVTGLAESRFFADRHAVREEQRRCAAALQETRLPDDADRAFVEDDDPSAARICLCAGYTEATARSISTHCFARGDGRLLGRWVASEQDWLVESAAEHARCIQDLTCGAPVMYCADRVAP